MSIEANKLIIRRLIMEAWGEGDMVALDKIVSPDFIDHTTTGDVPSSENFKELVTTFRNALPDIEFTIEDIMAEDDKVIARWGASGTHKGELLGHSPTGNQISITGVHIYRLSNGKLMERWGNWDQLGLMQQIGVIPTPKQ